MKKLLLLLVLFAQCVFSSPVTHAYVMGAFGGSEMQMTGDHPCCPDNGDESEKVLGDNPCKTFLETKASSFQGKVVQPRISFIDVNIFQSDQYSLDRDYIVRELNLPPPIVRREIKNYTYRHLFGIIKNTN